MANPWPSIGKSLADALEGIASLFGLDSPIKTAFRGYTDAELEAELADAQSNLRKTLDSQLRGLNIARLKNQKDIDEVIEALNSLQTFGYPSDIIRSVKEQFNAKKYKALKPQLDRARQRDIKLADDMTSVEQQYQDKLANIDKARNQLSSLQGAISNVTGKSHYGSAAQSINQIQKGVENEISKYHQGGV